jgi:hypothetical protein
MATATGLKAVDVRVAEVRPARSEPGQPAVCGGSQRTRRDPCVGSRDAQASG